jgi:UDP-N-acetylmuramate dehydrogenase
MKLFENISLKPFNTFGVEAKAKRLAILETRDEIIGLVRRGFDEEQVLILNGGSNVLFTQDFDGLVIKLENKGIDIIEETKDRALVEVQAGENWDEFVQYCLEAGYYGFENLSLIPGNAGAAPIQNIGAYGVEQRNYFHSLDAIEIRTGKIKTFSNADCRFGYRDSVFKNELKDRYIILSVIYKLPKQADLKLEYGAISKELGQMGVKIISPLNVAEAVCNIRRSKLPDPELIGNAGSFFKNPVVSEKKFLALKDRFSNIVAFPQDDGNYKIAAGWMIDHLGWKGKREGDAGVSATQALVLVNYQEASGSQIVELAEQIQTSVENTFGIRLETEVNII